MKPALGFFGSEDPVSLRAGEAVTFKFGVAFFSFLKVGGAPNWFSISAYLPDFLLIVIDIFENFDEGDFERSEFKLLDLLTTFGDLDREDFFSSSTYISWSFFGDFVFFVGWDEDAVCWDETGVGSIFLAGDLAFGFATGDLDFCIWLSFEFEYFWLINQFTAF